MGYKVKADKIDALLAMASVGYGVMALHHQGGTTAKDVNLFGPLTEYTDHNGYAIVWYGTGTKTGFGRYIGRQKRHVRVIGVEYLKLKAIFDALRVDDFVGAGT